MGCLYTNSVYCLFNDEWSFKAPGKAAAEKVTLPHWWNATGWSYEPDNNTAPSGTGEYTKIISGNELEGCYLRFEGVSVYCEVYVNNVISAKNIGAYKSFCVKLENLSSGENVITVRVTDKASVSLLPENCDDIFTESPRYKRWPVGFGSSLKAGGIWRDVYIVKKNAAYLNPFVIKSDNNGFYVQPDIEGNTVGMWLECTLEDDNGKTEIKVKAETDEFYIAPKKAVLSWPLKPHLYKFTVRLTDGKDVLQTITQPASLMNFAVRNSEFHINDKPYFLRGQNGFPHCNIAHDREYIKKYVSMVKAQGVEISRFHTEPPAHEWLDECDRQGIMVILEMPLHGSFGCYSYGSREFCENALSETLNIVKEYRRHPSIVLWSMGNELIVACERDRGLGKPIFDVLEQWIAEVRKLDSRPVIPNSNGDAANLITKSVGDVDDVHQYGGWYTENLYDLRHFSQFTMKNDMLFQPCISTESIAGYTDENECFFVKNSNDIRQKKVVAMRLGEIYDLAEQSRSYQCFMLKEYAEAMWRLRNPESSFAGYIPFGQYTWFFNPFDKDKIKPKAIWTTYKNVMSPVHVQFECFSRHVYEGESLNGNLRLFNECIEYSDNVPEFEIVVSAEGREIFRLAKPVEYHTSICKNVNLGPLHEDGNIKFEVFCGGHLTAQNYMEYKVYKRQDSAKADNVLIYDSENMLDIPGKRLGNINELFTENSRRLIVGPYALDERTTAVSDKLKSWICRGGSAVVLEQNPGAHSENILGCGIASVRVCQPQWSRWAMNLVKHADRSDICDKQHKMFRGVSQSDMFWWNTDTYLADSYLYCTDSMPEDLILSRIGNGLSEGELMPQKYDYKDSGYSITAVERKLGKGKILCTSLLLGTKYKTEPIAAKILNNLI